MCRFVYQKVFSPECLDAYNVTSSTRAPWDTYGDYGDSTIEWYIGVGRNVSNTSEDNTNQTTPGERVFTEFLDLNSIDNRGG